MEYVYTAPNCPRCDALKEKLNKKGIEFIERKGTRLSNPEADGDDIDIEAFVQLSMQNMVLPVQITKEEL